MKNNKKSLGSELNNKTTETVEPEKAPEQTEEMEYLDRAYCILNGKQMDEVIRTVAILLHTIDSNVLVIKKINDFLEDIKKQYINQGD